MRENMYVGQHIVTPYEVEDIKLNETDGVVEITAHSNGVSGNYYNHIVVGAQAHGVLELIAAWFECKDEKYRAELDHITGVAMEVKKYLEDLASRQ